MQLAVEQAVAPRMDVYAALDRQAEELPQVTLDSAGRVAHPALRDRIERRAFLALADRQPDVARDYVQGFLNRRWIGDLGFYRAVALAAHLPPDVAGPLLAAAARRDPGIALRQPELYSSNAEVLEAAILAARDEAVLLAALGDAMRASANSVVRLLGEDPGGGELRQSGEDASGDSGAVDRGRQAVSSGGGEGWRAVLRAADRGANGGGDGDRGRVHRSHAGDVFDGARARVGVQGGERREN